MKQVIKNVSLTDDLSVATLCNWTRDLHLSQTSFRVVCRENDRLKNPDDEYQ